MIKIEVKKNSILILGHANFDEYGRDIVCAATSSIVITSIEAISSFDENAIDIKQSNNKLEILINKNDNITTKLLDNMLSCLKELELKYPKNIKITYKEE